MDSDKLLSYIKSPDNLDKLSFEELSELLTRYPYFQAARLLYIKALKRRKDASYAKQLNVTAAHIPDRRKLFALLNQEPEFKISKDTEPEIHSTRVESPEKKVIRGTRDIRKRPRRVPPSFVPVDRSGKKTEKIASEKEEQEAKERKKEKELLEFDYKASRDETSVFEIEDDSGAVELIPESNYDLIEEFIKKDPRIVPKENDSGLLSNVPINESDEIDDYITETLAEIYISQGYFIKAINSYEKLSLKFPEKSTYFAARIKEVENLIKNQ